MAQVPEFLLRGLGPRLNVLRRPAPVRAGAERISISDVEVLSSYNWVKPAHPPTIMVPGGPKVLRPSIRAVQLEKMEGPTENDPHSSRLGQSPTMQTLFQAVEVLRPECRFDNVDIVASRIVMDLLRTFCGAVTRNRTFGLNASVVHNSLILEHRTKAWLDNGGMVTKDPGYGISFEEHVCDYPKGLEDSVSHWRILRYSLGPLKCVVRYEADATKYPYGDCSEQTRVVLPAPDDRSATVVLRGHLTPQANTIEIKSAGHNYPWDLRSQKPEIWAGCTGYLLRGRHADGLLKEVHLVPMLLKTTLWERKEQHQMAFRMLPHLISELKEAVRAAPGRHAALIFRPYPLLQVEVYDAGPESERLVSEYMVNKFWNRGRTNPARED
ncbi:hypothetical protein PG988_003650 [Apiospora saccharicola]